jgi:serine/threonine protein kinase
MGIVYRATENRRNREVAIKVPKHLGPRVARQFRARFKNEELITAQLHEHPGVPPVYDSGETRDNRPYYPRLALDNFGS